MILTPKEILELFPEHNISIVGSFDRGRVYDGYFKNTHVVIKTGTSDTYISREVRFLKKGLEKGISFLPKIHLFESKLEFTILVKDYFPGVILNETSLSEEGLFTCEKHISSQILELYSHGLCANDLEKHNVLYDSETSSFTLFDYDCGTYAHRSEKGLLLQVVNSLCRLHSMCGYFNNTDEYISEKLKIPCSESKQLLQDLTYTLYF